MFSDMWEGGGQGRQFVFRSGGDNNRVWSEKCWVPLCKLFIHSTLHYNMQATVYCQVLKLFEYWFGKLVFEA